MKRPRGLERFFEFFRNLFKGNKGSSHSEAGSSNENIASPEPIPPKQKISKEELDFIPTTNLAPNLNIAKHKIEIKPKRKNRLPAGTKPVQIEQQSSSTFTTPSSTPPKDIEDPPVREKVAVLPKGKQSSAVAVLETANKSKDEINEVPPSESLSPEITEKNAENVSIESNQLVKDGEVSVAHGKTPVLPPVQQISVVAIIENINEDEDEISKVSPTDSSTPESTEKDTKITLTASKENAIENVDKNDIVELDPNDKGRPSPPTLPTKPLTLTLSIKSEDGSSDGNNNDLEENATLGKKNSSVSVSSSSIKKSLELQGKSPKPASRVGSEESVKNTTDDNIMSKSSRAISSKSSSSSSVHTSVADSDEIFLKDLPEDLDNCEISAASKENKQSFSASKESISKSPKAPVPKPRVTIKNLPTSKSLESSTLSKSKTPSVESSKVSESSGSVSPTIPTNIHDYKNSKSVVDTTLLKDEKEVFIGKSQSVSGACSVDSTKDSESSCTSKKVQSPVENKLKIENKVGKFSIKPADKSPVKFERDVPPCVTSEPLKSDNIIPQKTTPQPDTITKHSIKDDATKKPKPLSPEIKPKQFISHKIQLKSQSSEDAIKASDPFEKVNGQPRCGKKPDNSPATKDNINDTADSKQPKNLPVVPKKPQRATQV